jgi:hypothetical protein
MRLIIAGSRSFDDFGFLEKSVLSFLKKHKQPGEAVEVISGHALGADKLGERFAEKYGLKTVILPAKWDKHGKAAGHIRNKEMAEMGSHCVVFWDGQSTGSKNMVDTAGKRGLCLEVFTKE